VNLKIIFLEFLDHPELIGWKHRCDVESAAKA
jgi:hypothetical protein